MVTPAKLKRLKNMINFPVNRVITTLEININGLHARGWIIIEREYSNHVNIFKDIKHFI